jgi:hypothetical protein
MATKKTKSKSKRTKSAKGAVKRADAKKNRTAKKKIVSKKKTAAKGRTRKKAPHRRIRGRAESAELVAFEQRGLGAATGGQSGDTQGLSGLAETDSESVQELLEEGQSFEAEVVRGVENARDPDESEVTSSEVPEDDVPEEYRDDADDGPERNARSR